jgi:hypothetical protein
MSGVSQVERKILELIILRDVIVVRIVSIDIIGVKTGESKWTVLRVTSMEICSSVQVSEQQIVRRAYVLKLGCGIGIIGIFVWMSSQSKLDTSSSVNVEVANLVPAPVPVCRRLLFRPRTNPISVIS